MPEFSGGEADQPGLSARKNNALESLSNILLTYHMYEPTLGYVQGMSDLLSPLYAVIRDESETFAAFKMFMTRMSSNFAEDQQGMHGQLVLLERLISFMRPGLHRHLEEAGALHLFFCFRWLLIWFKREFSFDDIMRLWEVLWTDNLGQQFHIFVALAILDQHQEVIMEHLYGFDEILKVFSRVF